MTTPARAADPEDSRRSSAPRSSSLDELPRRRAHASCSSSGSCPAHDIDELVEQIVARAGGNAFFIQELLDTLIERGILVADADDGEHPGLLRWVKRDAPIHVPSTVEDLILTRIDALPPAEKEALVHAAVLGRHVSAARARRAARPPGAARARRAGAPRPAVAAPTASTGSRTT